MRPEFELAVDREASARFPEVRVAAFLAAGLTADTLAGSADALAAEASAALRERFVSPADVVADPRVAGWRDAIRACGLNASDVRSSAEQLARRFLAGDGVRTEHALVRAYCALSAKHLAPVGAYDADRLPARTVTLRPARRADSFEPLGGRTKALLVPEVVVYAADGEVLCWAFNHRDSARTALRPETRRALFVTEAAFATQHAAMHAAADELRRILVAGGARVGSLAVVGREEPRATVARPEREAVPR